MNNEHQLEHQEYLHDKKKFPIYIILDNVEEDFNIGSMFRLSDAFGVKKIYLCGDYSKLILKKINKISRNTVKYTDYEICDNLEECINNIKKQGFKVIALEITNKSLSIDKINFDKNEKIAIIIGNEKHGVSKEGLRMCSQSYHIDMFGNNSSINVAVATGIALNQCATIMKRRWLMSDTGRSETINCEAGDIEINLTRYLDKDDNENYVTQVKKDGEEVFHVTKHPDDTVNYTDKEGRRKIR